MLALLHLQPLLCEEVSLRRFRAAEEEQRGATAGGVVTAAVASIDPSHVRPPACETLIIPRGVTLGGATVYSGPEAGERRPPATARVERPHECDGFVTAAGAAAAAAASNERPRAQDEEDEDAGGSSSRGVIDRLSARLPATIVRPRCG